MITDATILIVDDNIDFHTVATAVFTRMGYSVKSIFQGSIEEIGSAAERCDIVLLDVDLPGDNGVDICRAMKGDPVRSMIPVILITGNADVDKLCVESKADACLLKPFSSSMMAEVIDKLLAHPNTSEGEHAVL